MTQTNTATVKTLTAEVRVLMVGSRQVTLSVAKQLDRMNTYEHSVEGITAFGRVKTGAKDEDGKEIKLEVIGRSNRASDYGALVIFEFDGEHGLMNDEDLAAFRNWGELPLIVLAGLK